MKTTMTIAANLNCNPFVVFDQDIDEVIMIINFYIKSEKPSVQTSIKKEEQKGKIKRVKVNDKTATGGWF